MKEGKTSQRLVILILIGIIGYFLIFVNQYSLNAPYFDDFRVISIMDRLSEDPLGRFTELFQNFNGHRFALPFSLMWLDTFLEGSYNLKTMMLLGGIIYVGFFVAIYFMIRHIGLPLVTLIPIALLMFQPAIHRNIFWPISTLQYMTSVLLTAVMFYGLSKNERKYFWLALITGALHPYTNGNGIYILVLGIFQLLIMQRYKDMAWWSGFVAICAFFFYFGMPTFIGLDGYSNQADQLVQKPLNIISGFFSFLGSTAFAFRQVFSDTVVVGVAITLLLLISGLRLIHSFYKSKWKNGLESVPLNMELALYFTGLAMVITAAGAAISRGYNSTFMIVDRYFIYSVMGLVVAYALFMVAIPKTFLKKALIAAIPLSLFYCTYMYWYYTPEVKRWNTSLETDLFMLQKNNSIQGKLYPFKQDGPVEFHKALNKGIYKYPQTVFDQFDTEITNTEFNEQQANAQLAFEIEEQVWNVYGGVKYFDIISKTVNNTENKSEKRFVFLKECSNKSTYVVVPEWNRNWGYRSFIKMKNPYTSGFTAKIYQDTVKPGCYRIGLLTIGNGKADIQYSNQIFEMPEK